MKKQLPINLEKLRVPHPVFPGLRPEPGSLDGCFSIPYGNKRLFVMSTIGDREIPWEHVSISLSHRTPTWEEMCFIKNLFWERDELVLQFHPPEKEYVNSCKNCLHLWKPWDQKIELPPRIALAF